MSLRQQILEARPSASSKPAVVPVVAGATHASPIQSAVQHEGASSRSAYQALKKTVHQKLIERVDLDQLNKRSIDQIKHELSDVINSVIGEDKILLNEGERRRLVMEVQDEMLGLGPLEPLLADPQISDILVNTARQVYIERFGRLELTDTLFRDDAHLLQIIERIVSRVGRRIDESNPMVDARLADGSRVNAIIPPSALDGPLLSIRRFPARGLSIDALAESGSMSPAMAKFLKAVVQTRLNIVVSGGTGSGKTTLLNALAGFIADHDRVVTIEDAAELQLQQPHVLRLETRPPNIEGRGEITQQALLRNALRMRPDRIVLGEIRGAEAFDMLNAMNTGHDGSFTTVHANTPRDALSRLENLITLAGVNMPIRATRYQIASVVHIVVQVARLPDGKRKVMSIQEVVGMEGEVVSMQEIFAFTRTGIDASGAVQGYFSATGIRPKVLDRMTAHGVALPDGVFDPARHVMP
ncbi:pilus assembly protein CpaF [Burkholderia ubonensis]|uniref:CpaF family protein n=1 Tax=Burkholderia ubonensis TaxID=101571 RepID=UPI00075BF404|nr:CpaF family protein [Burkholderia ubonensis]KVN98544.1 pilus assembly protein CpaF [Burkholderia ubonensis]